MLRKAPRPPEPSVSPIEKNVVATIGDQEPIARAVTMELVGLAAAE
jgi:hypothetical protein